jgi:hypothetical protein
MSQSVKIWLGGRRVREIPEAVPAPEVLRIPTAYILTKSTQWVSLMMEIGIPSCFIFAAFSIFKP